LVACQTFALTLSRFVSVGRGVCRRCDAARLCTVGCLASLCPAARVHSSVACAQLRVCAIFHVSMWQLGERYRCSGGSGRWAAVFVRVRRAIAGAVAGALFAAPATAARLWPRRRPWRAPRRCACQGEQQSAWRSSLLALRRGAGPALGANCSLSIALVFVIRLSAAATPDPKRMDRPQSLCASCISVCCFP